MEYIPIREAEKTGREMFIFTDDHPLHSNSVAVYRLHPCIPVFQWNWLGSTKNFATPLTQVFVDASDPDFLQKEEYAKKFMILFLPFRAEGDLMLEGSYQRRWQYALDHGQFADSMIEIAENIQNIQNSLDASLTPNLLKNRTILMEAETFTEEDDSKGELPEDYLTTIGELFASEAGETGLNKDANKIDPKFCGKVFESTFMPDVESLPEFVLPPEEGFDNLPDLVPRAVFSYTDRDYDSQPLQKVKEKHSKVRFQTTIEQLNTLHLSQQVIQGSFDETTEICVTATGSCESIESWGLKAKLDPQQLTAYEIITASYILSFYEEAKATEYFNYDNENYLDEKKKLYKLARRNENSKQPLRLFVTGGGGAGKCKL
jgi:hypothetical protein